MDKSQTEAEKWLPAARAGCPEALGQLLEGCRRYLLWVARRALDPDLQAKGGASDLVQETFLEAQRDFPSFHGTTEAELLAWLRRLLLNNLANFARRYRGTAKRQADREVSLEFGGAAGRLGDRLAADVPAPEDPLAKREQAELLQRALAQLPDEYRQVVTWWYQEELPFEEIGRRLGRSASAARSLWWRALKRLQQMLERLDAEG